MVSHLLALGRNEFVGSLYNGRRGTDGAMMPRPFLIQGGRDFYDFDRLGDYSATSIDSDGSFFTIQQNAEIWSTDFPEGGWAAWISNIKKGF